MSAPPDVEAAVRAAIAVLDRASDSWQNSSPTHEGPLHWPVAAHFARQELKAAFAMAERLQERAGQLDAIARS